ncbi:MAG TPA: MFS transporter, partial [Caulobacteraceae bacterium]|nr:MFS transporter [Caulobacteraceae bacterium]
MSQAETGTEPEPPWPRPVYAWYVIGVLLFAYTLSFVDRTVLSLLIGPLRASLHISDTQVSLLLGLAFAVFYTLMGLPLGWVADHWSRRTLIGIGVALWSLMTAGCGLARSYNALFLMRVGVGVGEATLSPAAYSLISDHFPKARLGRAVAVYSIGVPLGSGIALALGALVIKAVVAAPPLSLPIIGVIEPWRLTFLWIGLPGLLAALLMATVRE